MIQFILFYFYLLISFNLFFFLILLFIPKQTFSSPSPSSSSLSHTNTNTTENFSPQRGDLEFDHVVLVYRPGLKPALSGISFKIAHGTRVGIVGRTGCGKSSCLLALFRMAPVVSGNIYIDGVNTARLPKKSLR